MTSDGRPVLILGGGINGAAIARELVLNRVPVCVVDRADIGGGATAASSRLIHGGLRYLEYAEFRLVRESLAERERLLRLAPHFVRPLQFFIPVQRRASGFAVSAAKFFRSRLAGRFRSVPRGLWLVRAGLTLYDLSARKSSMPRHAVHRVGEPGVPPVDSKRFRWLCSYYDAQMEFPERFTVALLRDAERLAAEQSVWFRVFPYRESRMHRDVIELSPTADGPRRGRKGPAAEPTRLEPAMIVNATGAWVDRTLAQLNVPSPQLIGGTKGSHFLTRHGPLREALGGRAIYAEASDGRPVFLLPLGPLSLVGTTDLPFDADPSHAVADEEELEYLLDATRRVFPHIPLTRQDVDSHWAAVRPLPLHRSANPASVTRRHLLEENRDSPVPLVSLIGGKLTSCREVAEETAALVLKRLGRKVERNSRDRTIPGGESFGGDESLAADEQVRIARQAGLTEVQVRAAWRLCGSLAASMVTQDPSRTASHPDTESLPGTHLPRVFARHVIRTEWCTRLADLVERRLVLLFQAHVTDATLRALASLMVEEGLLAEEDLPAEVDHCRQRLRDFFGVR